MTDEIDISLEAPNGRTPNRLVKLMFGGRVYTDAVDPLSGFQRQKLLDRAASALGVERSRMADIDAAIVQQAQQAPERMVFPAYTLSQLRAMDLSVRYLIEDVLAENQPLVMAGPKKALKTSLLLDLAISLATAGKFLGYFPVVEAARVGVMTGESGLSVILETAERIARAAGKDIDQIPALVVSDRVPILADLHHLDGVERWLTSNELAVLIIDPLYMALDDTDPANLFAVGRVLRNVNEVCQRCGATLIIAHHTKKGVVDPHSPGELEDLAWAGTAEWCRQWILVSRREKYIPGTGDHRLWLVTGGSAGHSGCWGLDIAEGTRKTLGGRFWDAVVLHADEARTEAEKRQAETREKRRDESHRESTDRAKRRVVDVLVKRPAGETARAIREEAGLDSKQFRNALSELLRERAVELCDLVKTCRRAPYEAYKLVG